MTWQRVPLKKIGTWYGGGTPSKSNVSFWTNGTIPWLSPKDMGVDVLAGTQDLVTQEAVDGSAAKLVPAGSVAVVTRSGILERMIPVALVPFETTLNQDMKAVVPHEGIDPRWVAWGLRAFERELLRETRKAGTTVASIEMPRFHTFELPVPLLDEQHRIIDLLEDHLSRLDVADAGLHTSLARAGAMLTSGTWHTTHGLHGAEKVQLQCIAEVRLGRQRSPKNHSGDRMRPYVRAANVGWDELRLDDVKEMQFTEAEELTYRLEPGDILLTEASGSPAEVGKSAIYRGEPSGVCFQNTLLRVRCHAADPEFVQKYLLAEARAGRFLPESRGVGINHLGRTRLAALQIDVPTPAEQAIAVAACRELVDTVGRLRSSIRVQARRSDALRRSLLAAAFSGRLTGSASDLSVAEEMIGA